jgi:hypothetical protein
MRIAKSPNCKFMMPTGWRAEACAYRRAGWDAGQSLLPAVETILKELKPFTRGHYPGLCDQMTAWANAYV